MGRLWVWVLIRQCHGGARGHLAQPPALQTGNDLQAVVSFRLSRQLLGVLQKTSRFFLKDLTTPDHLPIKQRCLWWQLQGARQEISVCVRARAHTCVYAHVPWRRGGAVCLSLSRSLPHHPTTKAAPESREDTRAPVSSRALILKASPRPRARLSRSFSVSKDRLASLRDADSQALLSIV